MSKITFKTFCVELYAEHTKTESSAIYETFLKSELLELLDSDYEDLHGMSMEYLMNFFDEYLSGGKNK